MVIPKINSAHGSDTRNIINRVIEVLNQQGKSLQDLVAEGQLTPAQYAELLKAIHNNADKSEVRLNTSLQPINVSEMDTETKQLFTGGSVAVVGENAVGKENLKSRSVSIPKLDFTVPSDNLFNGVYTEGLSLVQETSEQHRVSEGGVNSRSIIIAVEPQSKYELKIFDDSDRYRMSLFSEYPVADSISKRRIAHSDSTSAPISRTIQTEDNEHYLFIYLSNSREEPRVNLLRSELDYLVDDFVPYGVIPSDNIELSKKMERVIFTNSFDVTGWEYGNLSQGNNSETGIKKRVRTPIFKMHAGNTVKLQEGTSIQDMTIHLYNPLTGEFIEHDESIERLYVKEFTADKEYLVRIASRFHNDADIDSLDYYNGKVTVYLQETPDNEKTMNTKYISGNFTEFYKSKDFTHDINIGTSNHHDVYVAWDNLMNEHPNIITKKQLGYATNTNGGEDLERPIFEYEINTNRERPTGIPSSPIFLVITGVHGTERGVVWSTFHYFEQLLKNWSESDSLASVRSNVTFKIIPVYNPYGYDNKIRTNARGVDPNRNLSYNWTSTPSEEGTKTYKGTAPYSEQESKVLIQWLEENRKAFAFVDFHAYGGVEQPETVERISYITTAAPKPPIVYTSLIKRLSLVWERDYFNKEEGRVYGWANVSSLPATGAEAYTAWGIDFSATIEMAIGFKTRDSNEIVEMGVDLLANYISSSIDYLINS